MAFLTYMQHGTEVLAAARRSPEVSAPDESTPAQTFTLAFHQSSYVFSIRGDVASVSKYHKGTRYITHHWTVKEARSFWKDLLCQGYTRF